MSNLSGMGMWIWQIPRCEGGHVNRIAQKAADIGLTHVLVKVADGRKTHKANANKYRSLCSALARKNIGVWVWQYVYANDPNGEAENGAVMANSLNADGFVIDAEKEYKGQRAKAREYAKRLKRSIDPDISIGFSSFYLPSYHRSIPWREFLEVCDYNMPQIYWHHHNSVWAVDKSIRENREFGVEVFPTLGAYTRIFHRPNTMRPAIAECKAEGVAGVNFWSWQHAGAARWSLIRKYTDVFSDKRLKVVDKTTGQLIECDPAIEDGVTRVDLRPFAEFYGSRVYDRIDEQDKVYVEEI